MGGDVGVTVEELAVGAAAHGVHPQQHLLQKFTGIQGIFFSVIVLICFFDHIVQVGHDGIVGGLQSCEVGIIIQAPPVIEPLQHQFDGVDVTVGEVFVGFEEVFQKGDVLGQLGLLPEGHGRFQILLCLLRRIRTPQLRLQRVYDVLAAHHIGEASTEIGAEILQLMLSIKAQHLLAALQHIAEQELLQIAFALTTVAQHEDTAGGFVITAPLQIHDDVGPVSVLSHIEAMGVRLTGEVEWIQICHRAGRQDTLIQSAEGVVASRVCGSEAFPLTEQDAVGADLRAGQLGHHLIPQRPQALTVLCGQLQKDGTVDERLLVPVRGGDQGDHILQLGFGRHTLLEVVRVASLHTVFVGGVVNDRVSLGRGDLTVIDPQGHSAFFSQMPQDRQFLSGDGIAFQCENASVCSAEDIVIRIESDGGGGDHVEKVLGRRRRYGLRHRLTYLLLCFLRCHIPTSSHSLALHGSRGHKPLLHIGIIGAFRILPHPVFRIGVFLQLEGMDAEEVDAVIAILRMHLTKIAALIFSAVGNARDPDVLIVHRCQATFLHRSVQTLPLSRPADSRRPAGA